MFPGLGAGCRHVHGCQGCEQEGGGHPVQSAGAGGGGGAAEGLQQRHQAGGGQPRLGRQAEQTVRQALPDVPVQRLGEPH